MAEREMSMVERVARAICASQTQDDNAVLWEAFLPEATAAIQAMRYPEPHHISEAHRIYVNG